MWRRHVLLGVAEWSANHNFDGGLNREYERQAAMAAPLEPFPRWMLARCSLLPDGAVSDVEELRDLSRGPSTRVCSFRSMISHGSHFRVEEEGGASHVTYDCGVAELQACSGIGGSLGETNGVELRRVGTLKDILVFNYGSMHIVLMAVSWLTEHTELQPRLRRDAHGFWLANMAALPRSSHDPYILPSMASQVGKFFVGFFMEEVTQSSANIHPNVVWLGGLLPGFFRGQQGESWLVSCAPEGSAGKTSKLLGGRFAPRPRGI